MPAQAIPFSEAIGRRPMAAFQWITVFICMAVLVSDGIDMQLLGILAPLVMADFGVDRSTFGIAMSAALIGFGLGAWGGGRLGDVAGRRLAMALAALVFSVATIAAGHATGVWSLAGWRIVGGLGFGGAYANSLAMAGEWQPPRLRAITVSVLAVGTPIGGTVVGWLGPALAADHGWRGAFLLFGSATLVLVAVVLLVLRDSPSFLLARGRDAQAARVAARVLPASAPLAPERDAAGDGESVGVLDRSNLRFNTGIGLAFASAAMIAYGILNWSTTILTAAGFTLADASHVLSLAGITSMGGAIVSGILTRRYGSRRYIVWLGALSLLLMLASMAAILRLPPVPTAAERLPVVVLIGAAGAVFSGAISTMYVVMVFGYPQSCRSAGIGFGIFMSRVGAIAASGLGGVLLDWGGGSVVPFFLVLAGFALLLAAAALVIDRHVPPMARGAAA
ncbi:MAG: MFS transporter [Sphingomonas fennica]